MLGESMEGSRIKLIEQAENARAFFLAGGACFLFFKTKNREEPWCQD